MLNSVILTVRIEGTDVEYDMELPASVPGAELCDKLLIAFKSIDKPKFSGIEKINIRIAQSGELLGAEQSLESAAVWDGNIVTIVHQ